MPATKRTVVRVANVSDCKAGPAPAFCIALSAPSLMIDKVAREALR